MAVARTVASTEISAVYKEELASKTCCRLLLEAIKYLLYQRHQIPLPYEQVKQMLPSETSIHGDGLRRKPKATKSSRLDTKKRQLVEDVEELFSQLELVFQNARVFKVCVMFGPTQVSSKESFTFQFPSFNDSDMDCTDKASGILCRKLIRTLITNEELASMKEISPTSMFLAVQIHREAFIDWFVPKRTFKPPHRGHLCNIRISTSNSQHDFTGSESKPSQSEDLLWFQAPVVVKGYKDKLES